MSDYPDFYDDVADLDPSIKHVPNGMGGQGRHDRNNDEIVQFIADFTASNGYPPSFREIGKAMKMSTSTVYDRLETLAGQGKIAYAHRIARSLRVL